MILVDEKERAEKSYSLVDVFSYINCRLNEKKIELNGNSQSYDKHAIDDALKNPFRANGNNEIDITSRFSQDLQNPDSKLLKKLAYSLGPYQYSKNNIIAGRLWYQVETIFEYIKNIEEVSEIVNEKSKIDPDTDLLNLKHELKTYLNKIKKQ